jgi:integrase
MKDGGRCPLHWEATVNGQVFKFSTGKVIELKHWDNQKKEAKKGCGYSMVLNGYLRNTLNEYEAYMIDLENKGIPLSKKKLEVFFRGEKKVTFYEFFDRTVKRWEGDKKPSTINSYTNTLKIMKRMDPDVDFADLDYEFVNKWDYYLKTERKNQTMGKFNRHKNLKTIIKEAMLAGYMTNTPYLHFKIKKQESKREFLIIEEVKSLMAFQLPIIHIKQQRTKDMFLLGCFTGLRFSDVVRLTWRNIQLNAEETGGLMTIEMQKTAKEVKTALIPPVIEILKRHRKENLDEPIFNNITNQAINRNLKVLMKLVGIDKNITFHCSRHTFACNHLEVETPIANLKDLMGHSDISQTQIYAKTLQKGLIESMDHLGAAYA